MNLHKKSEKGQALILIVLAIVGLIGITGLTIDGGLAYSDRRNAQNAADTAALAAGRMFIRTDGSDTQKWAAAAPAGLQLANSNGYSDNETSNFVDLYKPPIEGFYAGNNEYIQVIITSHVRTTFGRVVGITQMTNRVSAIARVKPTEYVNLFDGHAMVSLNLSDCHSFTHTGTASTTVSGSGIFVNSDCDGSGNQAAYFQNGSGAFTGDSLCTVGSIAGDFNGPTSTNCSQYTNPLSMYTFPLPDCPVAATESGNVMSPGTYSGTFPPSGVTVLESGVYCVDGDFSLTNADTLNGNGVIIYMINGDVSWQGGNVNLTAPTSGPFDGLLIYMPTNNSGDMTINGNVSHNLTGTILAPTSHVQINGTSGSEINGQIIGDIIDVSGTSDIDINYDDDQNYEAETPPYLELTE